MDAKARGPALHASDLFAKVPGIDGFLEGYRPRLRYFLIDEGRLRESELDRPDNVTAALFRIESSKDRQWMKYNLQRVWRTS